MLSPELKDNVRQFVHDNRARRSLIVLGILCVLTLPAELLCNSRPLLIRHGGGWYVPALKRYTELDFGGSRQLEPDYKSERFRALISGERTAGKAGLPDSDVAILGEFDPEPGDVALTEESQAILRDFDPEPYDVQASPIGAQAILGEFDPEPDDVPLQEVASSKPDPAMAGKGWMLWPPVRYDYAAISTDSESGRDALAAPWAQTIPASGLRTKSSWIDGHYLGTDDRGRDVLARLVYGFRVSLLFGLSLAISSTLVGCMLGAVQGFFGGWVDLLGQRATEIWSSLPQLYLLIILSSLLTRSITILFIILNLTSWIGMAAYMRAEFLRGRNLEYVKAARALGVSNLSIMAHHILPNSLTPIVTFFPFSVTGGILALVSLDFLGLGVPSPFPSIGELLAQGQANLHATWIILPTFLLLTGTLTLLTFVGDGLRNAFDPRRRRL